ncbi:TPA: signal recognition particle protein [Candidatus Gastranaerophilales bacterium HUM_6]|jgi:signal recognition particle subunit SRP54|nr:signal recognition particle protein [bacterium]MEE0496024.1 signal recognition particle protein [Cyanobacteriota bacterium]CDE93655.1 signal recognition particle protein [Fusobacterium sp. CAG:815]DAA89541.1 MAG TPA: signal recognition particle protein [Candidatus Gastranaerophilales bacterium HUM_6]DAA93299.1 MAG TPA: signal recognition particle protein [Candidatus Gastranaerophilales bacterium HUM_7]DAB00882.1 MAG TPA: signal recognition particle protein [Candidatus Gastranaerophilales ba
MFDNLSEKLQNIISKTRGQELTQDNMQEALREIRRALLEADVNLRVVKAFISSIKDKAEGENVLQGVDPSQQLIKIVHDELVELLGHEAKPLNLTGHPSLIMMLGLQGSGKTTSSAKLAVKLKKEGKNPLLVACDVYRPAAISQLQTLGQEIGCEVFTIPDSKDVQNIVQSAINYAKENGFNVLILDTAGRLQIDTEMMAELLIIDRVFQPQEKLLVIDAMTGQEAVHVAENFDAQIGLTGLVLTKLDGDSRGGSALSVVYCTNKPIKLTGTGEKLNALEDFYPERMATRILGMGDIVSLVERAQEVFDEKEALKMQEKMSKAEFSFNDFLNMQKQMKMFGSMDQILGMLPGVNLKQADREKISHASETEFKKIEVFIQSMTPEERDNPQLMNTSRKKRIAKGCGMDMHTINLYVKQFEQMRQMMGGMNKLQKMFGGFGKKNEKKAMVQAMKMMKRRRF